METRINWGVLKQELAAEYKEAEIKNFVLMKNPQPFIQKAWEDSRHCKMVCLVKCDPSTRWWATFWDYGSNCSCVGIPRFLTCNKCNKDNIFRGPKPGCEVRFFPKRIKFDPPKGFEGKVSSPSFPSALVIMDRRGL